MSNETERNQICSGCLGYTVAHTCPEHSGKIDEHHVIGIINERDRLRRENAELRDLRDRLQLEAQIHSGEARGQRATVNEIYQLITGSTGEPGDWNGAEPVRKALANIRAEAAKMAYISGWHDSEFCETNDVEGMAEAYAQSLREREGHKT